MTKSKRIRVDLRKAGGRAWQIPKASMLGRVKIECITTGSELLLGQVLNSHPGYLSGRLATMGLALARQTSVTDGKEAIGEVVKEAWGRSDLVIVTGGLGPTSDDVTREAVAGFLGKEMKFHPEILEKILGYFQRRGLHAPEMVRLQAMVPEGMEVLPNEMGTAPGLLWEEKGKILVLLPGPPRELGPMFEAWVEPRLRGWAKPAQVTKVVRVAGIGESAVQERCEAELRKLGVGEIGYCARPGEVDVRLRGADLKILEDGVKMLRKIFGEAVYGEGGETMEQVVVGLLAKLGQWVSVAESCTGGLVAHRLTNVPGASAVVDRTFVTYANRAKSEVLGVPAELIAACGAVSRETAVAMAVGCLAASGADHALALTGIAGPGGGTEAKPVGTVFVALASKGGGEPVVGQHLFRVERETFKRMASQAALDLLRRRLIRMI
jgi:nicotinamide-nucleotide amidase